MLFQGCRLAAAASALLLLAAASFVLSAARAQAQSPAAACESEIELSVLSSPVAPWKGAPLRVIFATEKAVEGELSLIAPDGKVAVSTRARRGGPPYFWLAEVQSPAPGTWRATLARGNAPAGCAAITREIAVRKDQPPRPQSTPTSIWPVRNAWDRGMENLYSAWIEALFEAPLDGSLSWPALHEGLRDKSRNVLFNHFGLNEDAIRMVVRPDCADLPYFLRAYFAFKMGLPFGYTICSRGDGGQPPRCFAWWNIQNPQPPPAPREQKTAVASAAPEQKTASGPFDLFRQQQQQPPQPELAPNAPAPKPKRLGLVPDFGQYLRAVADGVHSASGRTRAADENSDYYPVTLTQEALRPGTVYHDPYGHVLVIVKRVAQTDSSAGLIFAVDGQPDGTVSRRRFWRGNFLFATDPALGSPGFKRFRPVMRDKGGGLRRMTNNEIARSPQYGDFSLDPSRLNVEDFYDRMDDVLSPSPLDPLRAMTEAIAALEEQVKGRVTSVENGRKYQATAKGDASMPDGAAIFETTGAWEDFATPSRDLRLLIAIDVVRNFPDRVARRPERYAMPAGRSVAEVKAELEGVLASELASRRFAYTRSDGSSWTLSLRDMLGRMSSLEMGYNLNDCVEVRWGAPQGSEEAATCRRRAPQAQLAKMTQYRTWFAERRRPPRG
jgi:hypothetical protein